MPRETELFHLDDVLVTKRRFAVRQRSFSLTAISSFRVQERSRPWLPAVAVIGLASLAGRAAVAYASSGLGVLAWSLFVLAAAVYCLGAPRYILSLETAEGRVVPLSSRSRFLVDGVAKVLREALESSRLDTNAEVAPRLSVVTGRLGGGPTAGQPTMAGLYTVPRTAFHPGRTA